MILSKHICKTVPQFLVCAAVTKCYSTQAHYIILHFIILHSGDFRLDIRGWEHQNNDC